MSQYSIADCGSFPHKAKTYVSERKAHAKGYYSKSVWKRKGRDIIEGAEPMLAIAKAWNTRRPSSDEIILAYSDTWYLVTSERFEAEIGKRCCWPVYNKDQTRPRIPKKRLPKVKSGSPQEESPAGECDPEQALVDGFVILDEVDQQKHRTNHSAQTNTQQINTNSSSHSLPPYDGDTVAIITPNVNHDTDLTAVNNCARQGCQCRRVNNGRNGQIECRKVYFPQAFPWDDYPELDRYRSAVMYVFHLLHVRRFTNNGELHPQAVCTPTSTG